ncbi:MAG: superoxide dismutase family protein [Eubacteriales bacterium]|nr:superoxide dismutase family protein [Eubacteriales bacterium]
MNQERSDPIFAALAQAEPDAAAILRGSRRFPSIFGVVRFYQSRRGVYVVTEVRGLPGSASPCGQPVFAMHIHEGTDCSGNAENPFADAGVHFNPQNCPHPYHAGDLPPLFSDRGRAWSAVLTGRFSVREILGKTVILHRDPDDFTTQPSGNSGEKIACGSIRRNVSDREK